MSKAKKALRAKSLAIETVPTPTPTAAFVPETEDARDARAQACGKELRDLLKKYNCAITVPTLDISTGRIWPKVEIFAKPEAQKDV
jgi:hypothetical protein